MISMMGNKAGNRTSTTIPPPRLIPHVVSDKAKREPKSIWAAIPKSLTDASAGYEDITFARLNYAVTRMAWWLQENLVLQDMLPHNALAYMGPADSRYIILTIAAIKTGFKMLFLSPRNSEEGQRSVIEQADCNVFLCCGSMDKRARKLLQSHSRLSEMRRIIVPEQAELLNDEFVADFPYTRSIDEARSDPLVILHTSSTTGLPKTIPLNQGYGMHEDVLGHVPTHNGLDIITRKPFYGPCRMFVAMPLYHAGGIILTLLKSLYQDIVSVFQPANAVLSASLFDAILRHGRCSGCVIPPYLLEEMLKEPRYFDTLACLDFVQFGSGPLSQVAGTSLLTRQKNCPHFIGSSEAGLYILLELDDPVADWQYFRFHPWSGVDMRLIDASNQIYELFIIRSDCPRVPGIQPVFELFPELEEWPTRELYIRHKKKPDHWRCIGRNDDILVLSNGEKLNPVDTEGLIVNCHSSVTGALVIGQGRFAPGLLLEVTGVDTSLPSEVTRVVEEVWPAIQMANKQAPSHGKLSKDLILLTSANKPFLRTPKLSIQRQRTIDLYLVEITAMYDQYTHGTENGDDKDLDRLDLSSTKQIEEFLSRCISVGTTWSNDLQPQDDFFMFGMDSLQVTRLARTVNAALQKQGLRHGFDSRLVYENSTLEKLAEAIFELAKMTDVAGTTTSRLPISHQQAIEAMIEDYSAFDTTTVVPEDGMVNIPVKQDQLNILLTGSTGSLGSHLLLSLLANPRVNHVYCLNRAKDAKSRQVLLLSEQGVDVSDIESFEDRIHFLYSPSLGESLLGMASQSEYDSLRKSGITHIIHNAWPVNFNLSLSSFRPHVAGVEQLVNFCLTVRSPPKLIFVSSLSSVTALSSRETVPEAIVLDASAPPSMGYGESKYVAEHVLDRATKASQGAISTAILRVGQIAGPVKSSKVAWPAQEWFPSLIRSSQTVGALPDSLGNMSRIDWVPVDMLADGICELLENPQTWDRQGESSGGQGSRVYHVINPNPVWWSQLLPHLKQAVGVDRTISLTQWIKLVDESPSDTSSKQYNPAKKILHFYQRLADTADSNGTDAALALKSAPERFKLGNMAMCSKTFEDLPSVSESWITGWASHWHQT